jgi:hypothetical protein
VVTLPPGSVTALTEVPFVLLTSIESARARAGIISQPARSIRPSPLGRGDLVFRSGRPIREEPHGPVTGDFNGSVLPRPGFGQGQRPRRLARPPVLRASLGR